MRNLEVVQPGSFGDILFIQKLCKVLSESFNVYHNISPQMWSSGIDQLETPIHCGTNIHIPNDGLLYDCSAQAEDRPPADVMICKYEGAEIPYDDWSDYLTYNRDYDREKHLKEKLGIRDEEPYIIVNEYYSFNKIHKGVKNSIPSDYDGKIIYMSPNITEKVFDWCWIFENAEEIHSVDTSIHYIIETLDLKSTRLTIHPRHYYHSPLVYRGILNKPWEWIDNTEDEWKIYTQEI
jgi:hypothetical protein